MPLRLIQFSDIHFGCEDTAALAGATAWLADTPFDLLLLTGDITQYGHDDEFAAAGRWVAGLPSPWISTPGNHDTPWFGLGERLVAPFRRYEQTIGPADRDRFDGPGLAVRTLNSARGWQVRLNWSKGEVSRGQVEAAAAEFEARPADGLRVLACHHPLIEIPGEPMTSEVRGGAHAAKRLTLAGIDLVTTGHMHAPFVVGLPFGDGRTYAVGASTLSRRPRGAPVGFNVIDIADEHLTVQAMAWNGAGYDIGQTWNKKLRPRAS